MRHPNSESLAKAAEAARRREEETAKLADARNRVRDAQGIVRAAEGEVRVAEVREDVAAREVGLHLSDAIPPAGSDTSDTAYREQPRQTTSWFRGGRPPPPGDADSVSSEPDRRRWNVPNNLATWALALAIVALIVAAIALFLPKGDIVALGDVRREIRTALQPVEKKAVDAKATADKVDELNAAQFNFAKDLAKKQDAFEKSTNEALAKKCDCPKDKPAPAKEPKKPAAKPAKPAKPAAAAPVVPKAEVKVAKKDCEECFPTPKPFFQEEVKAKVCGIAIQKAVGDKTIIGRMQLDENPDHPGNLRIATVMSFEGIPNKVSRSPYPHSKAGDCNVDQATVYQHWPDVIKKFGLPLECVPVRLKG